MEAEPRKDTKGGTVVSLPDLVVALRIVEEELDFQVHRLNSMIEPTTQEEREYHGRLKAGYAESYRWVRTLRRYQQGRLDRSQGKTTEQAAEPEEGTTVIPRPTGR